MFNSNDSLLFFDFCLLLLTCDFTLVHVCMFVLRFILFFVWFCVDWKFLTLFVLWLFYVIMFLDWFFVLVLICVICYLCLSRLFLSVWLFWFWCCFVLVFEVKEFKLGGYYCFLVIWLFCLLFVLFLGLGLFDFVSLRVRLLWFDFRFSWLFAVLIYFWLVIAYCYSVTLLFDWRCLAAGFWFVLHYCGDLLLITCWFGFYYLLVLGVCVVVLRNFVGACLIGLNYWFCCC